MFQGSVGDCGFDPATCNRCLMVSLVWDVGEALICIFLCQMDGESSCDHAWGADDVACPLQIPFYLENHVEMGRILGCGELAFPF